MLAGGDQPIRNEIDNTTPWQVLARLSRVPGVKLAVRPEEILRNVDRTLPEENQAIPAFSPTHVMKVCSTGATLATMLDAISEQTGLAFDVVGDLSCTVNGQAKGPVAQVIEEIGTETGATITIAAD